MTTDTPLPDRRSVLLLGNHRQSLAVARSLADRGWRVVMGYNGDDDPNHGAHRSNRVSEVWHHPHYAKQSQAFDDALRELAEQHDDLAAVFPINEAAMRRVGPMREELERHAAVVMANPAAVAACLDKDATVEVCDRLGLNYPRSKVAVGLDELEAVCGELGLPCVVKPLDAAEMVFGVKAAIVQDQADLTRLLQYPEMVDRHVIAQQFINRPRHSVHLAAKDGRLIAAVDALALRTDRYDGSGFAVTSVTIDPPAGLRQATEQLVEALDYTGVGCLQFFMDPDTDTEPVFLEFNARLAGSFRVAEAAGVPMSEMALALGRGLTPSWSGPWDCQRGVRFAWTCGSLAGMLFERRRGVIGSSEAVAWLGRTAVEALRADCHISWSWHDPRPTLLELTRPLRRKHKAAPTNPSPSDSSTTPA